MNAHQQLLDKIVAYCRNHTNITALILIGSQARENRPADPYSDLDLILVAQEVEPFFSSDSWLSDIGKWHIAFTESTFANLKEVRVLFDQALDVDFVLIPHSRAQQALYSGEGAVILNRGFRFLLNKAGLKAPEPVPPAYAPPSQPDYANTVNDFWYHAVWTGKKLLRGELWAAKFCVDSYMKWKLLWMIEHYQHAVHGAQYNTWYGGRFLDSWADPQVAEGLSRSFAGYQKADMAAALLKTMELFRTLAAEVGRAYGFAYPDHADNYSTQWIMKHVAPPSQRE